MSQARLCRSCSLSTHRLLSGHPSPLHRHRFPYFVLLVILAYSIVSSLRQNRLLTTQIRQVCNLLFCLLSLQCFVSTLLGQTSQGLNKTSGNVITVEYDQKGRPTPREVRRKIAGYEGALARVMVPLNAVSDWRKLKDLREGQLERDLWATMKTRFVLDENSRARYGFSHPAHFNDFGDKEEMKRNMIKRMKIAKKDQLIFVPYSTMGHWLLLVIDMTSMEVFWLDSLVRKVVDLNVKFIVNDVMKVAAMEMGKRVKGNPTWELVKCPKQTGKKECGVYVMKFMKHLMEDPLVSTKSKLKELGEVATNGDEELNDLRLELVEYILDFINNGE